MGVGAWQVWKHGGWAAQKDALSLWVFQLIFNLFWNPLFFLKHDMSLALFDIGGMHLNPILSQFICQSLFPVFLLEQYAVPFFLQ